MDGYRGQDEKFKSVVFQFTLLSDGMIIVIILVFDSRSGCNVFLEFLSALYLIFFLLVSYERNSVFRCSQNFYTQLLTHYSHQLKNILRNILITVYHSFSSRIESDSCYLVLNKTQYINKVGFSNKLYLYVWHQSKIYV